MDPRIHAVRKDVADVALADRVFAPHYALPLLHSGLEAVTPMRAAPAHDATAVSELLGGEGFAVVDASGDWAWGFSSHDGYVGYVPADLLGPVVASTHMVTQPAALLFADRSIKAPVLARLPWGVRLAATGDDGSFLETAEGFVHHRHLSAIGAIEPDYVAAAARLAGAPYRWGGRSGDGIDCSGLVQQALALAGIEAPRDSDLQQGLGTAIAAGAPLRRGDLVFLPGHVGIMADDTHMLHANAFWMRVVTEPLADILARQPEGGGITALRRL
ncbi:C40 family peptidase [Sphingomonas abietis]|uniref:C40 family peptidase n=1 Tax=Sphingomonas abietis TaxID=3012344 RepID=A0ABY7NHT3_9SPHN|nr:C40 family peptidase [Sphingomonas abietis]WBO21084.1 C40 family peptidase [Sphingomonas abietis]